MFLARFVGIDVSGAPSCLSKGYGPKIDACMAPEGDTHAAALEGEFDMLLLADCKNNMEEFLDRLE